MNLNPNKEDKNSGWDFSFDALQEIKEKFKELNEETISLEAINDIIFVLGNQVIKNYDHEFYFTLNVEPDALINIEVFCEDLIELSKRMNVEIKAYFKTVPIVVTPDSELEDVIEIYHAQRDTM